jgi:MinD superfamily P-loop ATPase
MKKHIMENTSYLLSYYEQILQLINQFMDSHREYLNKHKIDFFVIYEISKKYPISIYFRVPFTQNIDGISFNGQTDILFATISFEYIVNRPMEKEGFIKLYQYSFKSLLFKYT